MASERYTELKFLTVTEVADWLRVSRMTVYRMIEGGELEAYRYGRNVRVSEQAVVNLLRRSAMDGDVADGQA
ncbi:helix-turn-helix domain-containing protein [Streptomyces sp. MS19]|uniref:helix-turn-helix domain-containing protein n=1 Tax=Streptomyces sp. MS19 TaxID=3385972 RepID=UPI0039A3D931